MDTEEQLEERTQEFRQEVEERIVLTRQQIMYSEMDLVGSMALTFRGLPPLGGVIARTVAGATTNYSSTSREMMHLHNVWDASLKKLLDIIENKISFNNLN